MSDLDLHIDRGMPEGEEIVFEGEADESPDLEAGDVIVRVRSKKEKGGFVRKDSNLHWKEPISVAEVRFLPPLTRCGRIQTGTSTARIYSRGAYFAQALLGFRHTVKGLDGHDIVLSRSGVTQPGQLSPLPLATCPQGKFTRSHPPLLVNRLRRRGVWRRHADLSLDRTRQPFRRVPSRDAAVSDSEAARRCALGLFNGSTTCLRADMKCAIAQRCNLRLDTDHR